MAENDVLKNELASQAGATTTTPTRSIATGNANLDAYNQSREQQINDLYDKKFKATSDTITAAQNRAVTAAEQARDKLAPQYQDSMNQLSAEYERQRRNNNLQAQMNGLNTGANSQMQLGQMNVYSQGQAGLQRQMNEAVDAANQNIVDIKTQFEDKIAEAAGENDYQRAAALLDEYSNQYQQMLSRAQQAAQYGDFSMYANIYGAGAAQQMEKAWLLQNPQLAYTLGKITSDEYFKMTGSQPPDVAQSLAMSGGGGGYGRNSVPQGWASGNRYTAYQQALNQLGANLTVDGMYGSRSQAAARQFDPNGELAKSYGIYEDQY